MSDLFVSSSHSDAALVDRCVAWLRTFGVTVLNGSAEDLEEGGSDFRLACFFLSRKSFEDPFLLQQIHTVAMANGPVLLLLLEKIDLGRLRSLPVLEVQTLEVQGLKPSAIGEALVEVLPDHGVLRHSVRRLQRKRRPNELRSEVEWAARARFAAVALIVISLAFLVRSILTRAVSPPHEQEARVVLPSPKPKPVVPPSPPVEIPLNPPPAMAPKAEVPEPAPVVTASSREDRAMEFVKQCIASAAREDGLTNEQIERVVSFFADPAFIEDKGIQQKQGIRSSMFLRQQEWPRWREAVESIKVVRSDQPNVVRVLVKTSYFGENLQAATKAEGGFLATYEVTFGADDHPLITRIEFPKTAP